MNRRALGLAVVGAGVVFAVHPREFVDQLVAERVGAPLEADRDAPDPWAAAIELRDATREFILEHCGEPDLAHEKSPL